MKRVLGNFANQPNNDFPLDCETLLALQTNQALAHILGNIAGDKVILFGCAPNPAGTIREEGYVFLRTIDYPEGEVIFFEGGSVSAGMYLKKVSVSVMDYTTAYTERSLAPGQGTESFTWAGFSTLSTNQDLRTLISQLQVQIALLAPLPLGIVQIWSGALASIPSNYRLCDGSELDKLSYPDLYAAIGDIYNNAPNYNGVTFTTTTGYFRLPDLRGRFVVGTNADDNDYNAPAKAGGQKNVTLTAAQSGLPSHTHQTAFNTYRGSNTDEANNRFGRGSNNHVIQTLTTTSVAARSASASHENRPPYYALSYIIRVS